MANNVFFCFYFILHSLICFFYPIFFPQPTTPNSSSLGSKFEDIFSLHNDLVTKFIVVYKLISIIDNNNIQVNMQNSIFLNTHARTLFEIPLDTKYGYLSINFKFYVLVFFLHNKKK